MSITKQLLVIITLLNSINLFSQKATLFVEFNGKKNIRIYRDHDVTIEGNELCLDYSKLSRNRTPINLKLKQIPKASFSTFIWLKSPKNIKQSAVILSSKKTNNSDGWEIKANEHGAWTWSVTQNEVETTKYISSSKRQAINDGKFHLIGMTYDYMKNQAWLYFDDKNVAIINIEKGDLSNFKELRIAGIEKNEKKSFNGYVKSLYFFNTQIDNGRALSLYYNNSKYSGNIGVNGVFYKKIKFMTWNICEGGTTTGEKIGLDRVLDVLKKNKVDVIALQETNGAGEYIADELGFYYYSISRELSILSRFPINRTIKLYKANRSGGVELAVSKNQYMYLFNVSLDDNPDWSSFSNKYTQGSYYVEKEEEKRAGDLREMMEQIRVILKPTERTSIVFMGELNSISNVDDYYRNYIERYPVANTLKKYKFKDSYRELYQNIRINSGYTRNINSKYEKKGRVDYIYYKGKDLKVLDSKVIKHHPVKFPSKYFGVMTEFKWL